MRYSERGQIVSEEMQVRDLKDRMKEQLQIPLAT